MNEIKTTFKTMTAQSESSGKQSLAFVAPQRRVSGVGRSKSDAFRRERPWHLLGQEVTRIPGREAVVVGFDDAVGFDSAVLAADVVGEQMIPVHAGQNGRRLEIEGRKDLRGYIRETVVEDGIQQWRVAICSWPPVSVPTSVVNQQMVARMRPKEMVARGLRLRRAANILANQQMADID